MEKLHLDIPVERRALKRSPYILAANIFAWVAAILQAILPIIQGVCK